jgi:hypothetical protein
MVSAASGRGADWLRPLYLVSRRKGRSKSAPLQTEETELMRLHNLRGRTAGLDEAGQRVHFWGGVLEEFF